MQHADNQLKKEVKMGTAKPYGSIYIIENPNPESIYFEEDFIDKKDDDFKCRKAKCEPDIINWANMNSSFKSVFWRKATTYIIVASIIAITMVGVLIFSETYINDNQLRLSAFMNDDYSCEAY